MHVLVETPPPRAVTAAHRHTRKKPPRSKAFVLAVTLTFPNLEARDAWIEAFKPLATHVRARERGALAYELLVADDDTRKVMVFER